MIFDIIIGIIQGITEFLPVSSSGHNFLFAYLSHANVEDDVLLQVALHFGTLCAILVYFYKDIVEYMRALVTPFGDSKQSEASPYSRQTLFYIVISTLPIVCVGVLFESQITKLFYNVYTIASMLILGGIAMIIVEYIYEKQYTDSTHEMTVGKALFIGVMQVLALIPGVSRSGITIISGLLSKLNRKFVAYYSFWIAIPLLLGVTAKKVIDSLSSGTTFYELFTMFGLSAAVAAITGYLSLRFFIPYISKNSLKVFAYYRIVFGIILLLFINS